MICPLLCARAGTGAEAAAKAVDAFRKMRRENGRRNDVASLDLYVPERLQRNSRKEFWYLAAEVYPKIRYTYMILSTSTVDGTSKGQEFLRRGRIRSD